MRGYSVQQATRTGSLQPSPCQSRCRNLPAMVRLHGLKVAAGLAPGAVVICPLRHMRRSLFVCCKEVLWLSWMPRGCLTRQDWCEQLSQAGTSCESCCWHQ